MLVIVSYLFFFLSTLHFELSINFFFCSIIEKLKKKKTNTYILKTKHFLKLVYFWKGIILKIQLQQYTVYPLPTLLPIQFPIFHPLFCGKKKK